MSDDNKPTWTVRQRVPYRTQPVTWLIDVTNGDMLFECPCCHLPFRTEEAARRTAEALYPSKSQT